MIGSMLVVVGGAAAVKSGIDAIRDHKDDEAEEAKRAEADQAARDRAGVDRGRDQLSEPHGYRSSDELLDASAAGLRFFAVFGPQYADWTDTEFDIVGQVYRPHDRVREFDFATFRADADRLARVGSVGESTAGKMWEAVLEVSKSWRGEAATTTTNHVIEFDGVGREVITSAENLGTVTTQVIDTVEGVVREFAFGVLDLYEPHCAGRGPLEIQQLIDLAKGRGIEGLANKLGNLRISLRDGLVPASIVGSRLGVSLPPDWLGGIADARVLPPVPPIWVVDKLDEQFGVQEMQRQAADWLNGHFVPAFTGKLESLHTLCDEVRNGVAGAMDQLDSAFKQIRLDAFDNLTGGTR